MDSKGRIVIPDEVRKELGLTSGSRVRISVTEDNSIIVMKSGLNPQEFIKQTEGLLKRGSEAKVADPLRLKEVWLGL
jgi:AbrB family looped-hinge helix DNA binding protein